MGNIFTQEYLQTSEKLKNWWDSYSLPFFSMLTSDGDEGYHNHEFFEIFYVTTGNIYHQVETQQDYLKLGDLFFIPQNIYHGFVRTAEYTCIHRDILVGPELIEEVCGQFSPDLYSAIINQPFIHLTLSESQLQVLDSLFNIYHSIHTDSKKEQETKILVKLIISTILSFYYSSFLTEPTTSSDLIERLKAKLSLCVYQNLEINDVLSTDFFYTQSYLCRFFKNKTGTTMTDYINELKLKRAKSLLTNTNLSVSKVASSLGFSSESYFFKLFKKTYGISPLQYRKKPTLTQKN